MTLTMKPSETGALRTAASCAKARPRRAITGALTALSISLCAPGASAAIIFADDFERPDNYTVGAPAAFPGQDWIEHDFRDDDVQIAGGKMIIRDLQGRARQTISTLGYENIVLSFTWRPLTSHSDPDAELIVGAPGSGGIRLSLRNGHIAERTYKLTAVADDLAVFDLSFNLFHNRDRDDGVRIDNVVVSGDLIGGPPPPSVVPEPAAWSLMLAGFAMLGAAVRGRRRTIGADYAVGWPSALGAGRTC